MTLCVGRERAADDPRWAFVPPRRPAVPEVSDDGWPRSAVDRFILARIEGAGGRFGDVFNPATGEVSAHCPYASAADVDRAVAAASAALPGWLPGTSP